MRATGHQFLLYSILQRVYSTTKTRMLAPILTGVLMLALPSVAMASGEREVASRVKPVYPEIAKRMKITGTVLLHVKVAPEGTVKAVNTVMGNAMLAEAAKEAVSHWKFAPAEYETVEDVEVEFK
jgi:TonB family protein